MNAIPNVNDELILLLGQLADGQLTEADEAKLLYLLQDDPAARTYYLDFMEVHAWLQWKSEGREEYEEGREECGEGREERGEELEIGKSSVLLPAPNPTPSLAIILDTSDSISPLSPSPSPLYVAHPFLFSNLFSLLILSVGIFGAWMYQIDIPRQIALDERSKAGSADRKHDGAANGLEFVGQVTAMSDVHWADIQTATVNRANVALGRKFALTSGLMEITYDTGAKVILQGPCAYQVDSRDGGYLAVGKLTARLEKKGSEVRGQGSENVASGHKLVASGQWSVASETKLPSPASGRGAGGEGGQESVASETNPKSQNPEIPNSQIPNPQSLIPNPSPSPAPIFAVRTPTATVTDLGTEFGVEVQESGMTLAHVYRGAVSVQAGTSGKPAGEPIRLTANESAEVKIAGDQRIPTAQRVAIKPPAFVRNVPLPHFAKEQQYKPLERWQNYMAELCRDPALVVYYDFQKRKDSPNLLHGQTRNPDVSLNGEIKGARWTTGRMPGKDALEFDGDLARVRVSIPGELKESTIATWAAILYVNDSYCSCCLLVDDWADGNCQGALQVTPDGQIQLGATVHNAFGTPAVLPWQERGLNRWRHVAVVADPSRRYGACYLDGKKVFEGEVPKDYSARFQAAHIGNWWGLNGKFERGLVGRMDEMVILARPMSEAEIMAMYEAGRR